MDVRRGGCQVCDPSHLICRHRATAWNHRLRSFRKYSRDGRHSRVVRHMGMGQPARQGRCGNCLHLSSFLGTDATGRPRLRGIAKYCRSPGIPRCLRHSIPLPLTLLVALADLIFFRLLGLCGSAYQAHERLDRTAGLQLLVSLARLCAAGLMVFFANGTATQWAALYCASTAAAAAAALVLATHELGAPRLGLPIRRSDLS